MPEARQIAQLFEDGHSQYTFADWPGTGFASAGDGDEIRIRFDYNAEMIDRIKTVGGAHWNPQAKAWEVPVNRYNVAALVSFLVLYKFTFTEQVLTRLRAAWYGDNPHV
jgi:hypothetical protein